MKGKSRGAARVGRFPWQTVAGAGAVAGVLLAAGVFSRRHSAPPPARGAAQAGAVVSAERAAGPEAARAPAAGQAALPLANVGGVLRHGRLPKSFSYQGKRYEAMAAGRYGARMPLVRAGALGDGRPVYYERRALTQPYQTLYLGASEEASGAEVYVRYRLAPVLSLP